MNNQYAERYPLGQKLGSWLYLTKMRTAISTFTCTLGYLTLLCFPALADQCSYITKEQASTAISRLNLNQTIYLLCEPCGEKIPEAITITNLSMETVNYRDYWQVKVNNRGIDLAYVFVDSGIEKNLINLAAISNCPARNISTVLPK